MTTREELILRVFYLIVVSVFYFVAHCDYYKDSEHNIASKFIAADENVHNQLAQNDFTPKETTAYQPRRLSLTPAGYHSEKVKFIHNTIVSHYFGTAKGIGLTVNEDIKFGEILSVEYPLLKIPDDTINDAQVLSSMNNIHQLVNDQMNIDSEFKKIWEEEMAGNIQIYKNYLKYLHNNGIFEQAALPQIYDLVKAKTNQFGLLSSRKPSHIYGILSKISLGFSENQPQNVAVIFGGKEDNFVCILIATTNISKGSELFTDKFFDWYDMKSLTDIHYTQKRMLFAAMQGFYLNDEWNQITKYLNSNEVTQKQKDMQIQKIYSNGIIGKASDTEMEIMSTCAGLTDAECQMKDNIKQFIDSRGIFDVIQGNIPPPKWTGKQFEQISKHWRKTD